MYLDGYVLLFNIFVHVFLEMYSVTSVLHIVGGAIGGLNGFYTGLKETRFAALEGAAKRTQMINFIAKHGASTAQTLGVVALMYSVFGVVLSKSRGVEDELNTLTAGTLTGLLYKSSAGLKTCLRGGAAGFGLSTAYVLCTKWDKVKQMAGLD